MSGTAIAEHHLRRVLVVDDDVYMRMALQRLFSANGYAVEVYESGTEFLERADLERPGCLVLDLSMGDTSGLEVQKALNARQCPLPVIFLTGTAAVHHAVDAMQAGATDFLEKPFENADLLRRVDLALTRDLAERQARCGRERIRERLARLTPRERQVLGLIVKGLTSKEIARELGTSHRTVELQRARIMEKTGAATLAALLGMVWADSTADVNKG